MNKKYRGSAIEELMSYATLGDNIIYNKDEVKKYNEIYHYTSPNGFKSIIEQPKIRFTDSRFLNDIEEQYNISNTIKYILDNHNNEYKKEITNILEKYTDKNSLQKIFNNKRRFIFSCSTEKDELSLWNYYIKQNNYVGYSIGFNPQKMHEALSKNNEYNLNLFKCVYNDAEKQKQLLDYINKANKALDARAFEHKQKEFVLTFLDECLYISSIIFKNEKFSSEKEIRFIYNERKNSNLDRNVNIKYRLTNGILIPYIEVPIDNINKIISSIIVGPGKQEEITLQGVKEFMSSHKISCSNIKSSEIPLRTGWNM